MPPAQIILAYANDPMGSLEHLDREMDLIYSYLNRMNKDLVNPVPKAKISIDSLFDEFSARKEAITIFHFSGHAGDLKLLFDKGEIAHGGGIAKLMTYASNIELVFLNGCATKDHIDLFHRAGVKRVIATSRKVFDDTAAEFSIKFYSSLSQFATVGEAYDYAKSYLETKNKEGRKEAGNGRHIATTSMQEDKEGNFPYGMYYRSVEGEQRARDPAEYKKYDEWKLGEEEEDIPEFKLKAYRPSVALIKCIGEKGMALVKMLNEQNPGQQGNMAEIQEFADLHRQYSQFMKGSQDIFQADPLSSEIISLLPQPLGILMRQMVSMAKDIERNGPESYRDLLKYQLRFYDVLVKLSCFTTLSDLFEIIQKKQCKKEALIFSEEVLEDIKSLLSLTEKETLDFNYRELAVHLREIILANAYTPFVHEYMRTDHPVNDHNLEIAHEIIKIQKLQFATNKVRGNLAYHCRTVEEELCNIFQEVYFVLRYNLLVIRNIEAIRMRFSSDRLFQHRVVLLRLGKISAFKQFELDNKDEYTENYSVILVKGLHSIINYLSLAPFVIDKCVLTMGDLYYSQLYFFSHADQNRIVYEGVEDASSRIEIEILKRNIDDLDAAGNPVTRIEEYIPYVDELGRLDDKLDKAKVSYRLRVVYEQFQYFKTEIDNIQYDINSAP